MENGICKEIIHKNEYQIEGSMCCLTWLKKSKVFKWLEVMLQIYM